MDFKKYEEMAMALRKTQADDQYARDGLVSEVGEYFDLRAKARRDGMPDNYKDRALKELGDILWFVAAIAMDEGFSFQEVAEANLIKLYDRKARGVLGGNGDYR